MKSSKFHPCKHSLPLKFLHIDCTAQNHVPYPKTVTKSWKISKQVLLFAKNSCSGWPYIRAHATLKTTKSTTVDAATKPTNKNAKKSLAFKALNLHPGFLDQPNIAGRYKQRRKQAITIKLFVSIFFIPSTFAAARFASISAKCLRLFIVPVVYLRSSG